MPNTANKLETNKLGAERQSNVLLVFVLSWDLLYQEEKYKIIPRLYFKIRTICT